MWQLKYTFKEHPFLLSFNFTTLSKLVIDPHCYCLMVTKWNPQLQQTLLRYSQEERGKRYLSLLSGKKMPRPTSRLPFDPSQITSRCLSEGGKIAFAKGRKCS